MIPVSVYQSKDGKSYTLKQKGASRRSIITLPRPLTPGTFGLHEDTVEKIVECRNEGMIDLSTREALTLQTVFAAQHACRN